MEWMYEKVTITGDRVGEDGKFMKEEMELWRRDPVAIVQELIGNPAFRDCIAYSPERVYEDEERLERVIDEMWTADWWWALQVRELAVTFSLPTNHLTSQ